MASSKRGRFIAIVIGLAVVALCTICVSLWVNEGPLWRVIVLRTIYVEYDPTLVEKKLGNHEVRGWMTAKRWTRELTLHGYFVSFYVENGMKACEGEIYGITRLALVTATWWRIDGRVHSQRRDHDNFYGEEIPAQPGSENWTDSWWWNVTAQTRPTAPWWDHEKNREKE